MNPDVVLTSTATAWRLTIGAIPKAIRLAKYYRASRLRTGMEYLGLNIACLVELVLGHLHATRFPIRRVRFLGYEILCFRIATLLSLVDDIFVERTYGLDSNMAGNLRILDCGSNIGASVLFFKKLFPDSAILCFEPDPVSCHLLAKNVSVNALTNVRIENVAVGCQDREIGFYRHPSIPGALSMSAMRLDADHIEVPCRRLSTYIGDHVDLLKLDVEGAELETLAEVAAAGKLQRIDRIILEYHHHIRSAEDRLSALLRILEQHEFGYYVHAELGRHSQQIHIYCYNKLSLGGAGELSAFALIRRPGAIDERLTRAQAGAFSTCRKGAR